MESATSPRRLQECSGQVDDRGSPLRRLTYEPATPAVVLSRSAVVHSDPGSGGMETIRVAYNDDGARVATGMGRASGGSPRAAQGAPARRQHHRRPARVAARDASGVPPDGETVGAIALRRNGVMLRHFRDVADPWLPGPMDGCTLAIMASCTPTMAISNAEVGPRTSLCPAGRTSPR